MKTAVNINDFLDPKLINSVADLELMAKMIAENLMIGINQSVQVGFGQEFSQYRAYEPGDDLRYLDWKLYARNDRYYVRQSEVESNITVRFLMDCSASMNHEYNGLKKIDFIKILVATFAYIVYHQNDHIALHGLKNNRITTFDTLNSRPSFQSFLYQLVHLDGDARLNISREQLLQDIHSNRKEITIFISDMYEEENEISLILEHLSKAKDELILFHVLAANEMDPSIEKTDNIEDLETGEIIKGNNFSDYKTQLKQFLAETERSVLKQNASYQLFSDYATIHHVVRSFLKRRERLQ